MDARVEDHLAAFKRGCVDLIEETQLTKLLEKSLASGKPLRVKFGMDPSSPDLHVGHGVQLMKLRDLQQLGHHRPAGTMHAEHWEMRPALLDQY